ncbi:MAG: DegT/DnrJ/EryC1/StrS family aminotransferase [Planctomycetaceae bacterium]
MTPDVYSRFGIQPVINCVGYATRVSGSCPHPDVIAAMASASSRYVEIDDLLTAASQVIQEATGAEAGIITCGAAGGLTLAAAACLAGNDPDIMDRLPDVSGCARDEIIYPQPGPFDYDHAIRMSGAKTLFVDYRASDALAQIASLITPRTAAIGFVWMGINEEPGFDQLVELAHQHGLPVIVDAAFAMPPVTNLTSFIRRGADLVAYSGGKHLGGPQASGVLCGRKDLIRSAWVQMVDMDVRGGTWSLQHWVDAGWISRSPRHGLGRSMKVSKESMIGLMVALQRYRERDHEAEYASWLRSVDEIYNSLKDLTSLRFTRLEKAASGQPYPLLVIEPGSGSSVLSAKDLQRLLRKLPRKILLAEDEVNSDRAYLFTQCLQDGDAREIVRAIRQVVLAHQQGANS